MNLPRASVAAGAGAGPVGVMTAGRSGSARTAGIAPKDVSARPRLRPRLRPMPGGGGPRAGTTTGSRIGRAEAAGAVEADPPGGAARTVRGGKAEIEAAARDRGPMPGPRGRGGGNPGNRVRNAKPSAKGMRAEGSPAKESGKGATHARAASAAGGDAGPAGAPGIVRDPKPLPASGRRPRVRPRPRPRPNPGPKLRARPGPRPDPSGRRSLGGDDRASPGGTGGAPGVPAAAVTTNDGVPAPAKEGGTGTGIAIGAVAPVEGSAARCVSPEAAEAGRSAEGPAGFR